MRNTALAVVLTLSLSSFPAHGQELPKPIEVIPATGMAKFSLRRNDEGKEGVAFSIPGKWAKTCRILALGLTQHDKKLVYVPVPSPKQEPTSKGERTEIFAYFMGGEIQAIVKANPQLNQIDLIVVCVDEKGTVVGFGKGFIRITRTGDTVTAKLMHGVESAHKQAEKK